MSRTLIALTLSLAALAWTSCETHRSDRSADVAFSGVQPILETHCLGCHQGSVLGTPVPDFRTRAGLLAHAYVVPGSPETSLLLAKVQPTSADATPMPPVGHALSPEALETIREWIRQGAPWPEGKTLKPMAVRARS
jgi:mono/diheme cytochrome c family protein